MDDTQQEKAEGRIGIEVEFGGIKLAEARDLIVKVTGGRPRTVGPYEVDIEETEFGTIELKLDTQFVHPGDHEDEESLFAQIEEAGIRIVGGLAEGFVPLEFVTEPLARGQVKDVDKIVDALRKAGARGTMERPYYAFGTHLNMEEPDLGAEIIGAKLRAYLLLSDWIREQIGLDLIRRLLPFVSRFPEGYVRRLMAPQYPMDQKRLIEDYLLDNPTRNRGLDMLPLFAYLDADLVALHVDDPRIKARPAYHYRLPNTRMDDANWSLVMELERWNVVEQLAADEEALRELADMRLAASRPFSRTQWAETVRDYLGDWLD